MKAPFFTLVWIGQGRSAVTAIRSRYSTHLEDEESGSLAPLGFRSKPSGRQTNITVRHYSNEIRSLHSKTVTGIAEIGVDVTHLTVWSGTEYWELNLFTGFDSVLQPGLAHYLKLE